MFGTLDNFGFLSLGFGHILSASVQRSYLTVNGGCKNDQMRIVDHELSELFSLFDTYNALVATLYDPQRSRAKGYHVPDDILSALAVLRCSIRASRGEFRFSLESALVVMDLSHFLFAMASASQNFLEIFDGSLSSLKTSTPFFPVAADRHLFLEGKQEDGEYVFRFSGKNRTKELRFLLGGNESVN
ncbi:amidophosphoribosyltransferase [Sediminispirochaeta smaragdinae]|uniref:amidophosphoribosyltransferase n=1 Tax=Sediminispirochaeta smaragdinae TaxID=55206 RepID=UPI0011D160A8|nr:amidophosphoribosyltransferase [Sediminispirochaeta smaragdinae]